MEIVDKVGPRKECEKLLARCRSRNLGPLGRIKVIDREICVEAVQQCWPADDLRFNIIPRPNMNIEMILGLCRQSPGHFLYRRVSWRCCGHGERIELRLELNCFSTFSNQFRLKKFTSQATVFIFALHSRTLRRVERATVNIHSMLWLSRPTILLGVRVTPYFL